MNGVFKALNVLVSVLGGMLAGAVFSRVWCAVTGQSEAPSPDSTDHRTSEVIAAAALQGALAGVIRASVNRAGARSARRLNAETSV